MIPPVVRSIADGRLFRVEAEGDRILGLVAIGLEPSSGKGEVPGIGPAFVDLQVNGRWGWSFSGPGTDPGLAADRAGAILRAQAELGATRIAPTLITASRGETLAGVAAIGRACDADPEARRACLGIHLEGPAISGVDGYRGAHPRSEVRDPSWDEFLAIQEAAGGRVRLVTLAPERPGAIEFVARAVASGIVIALGHTAADPATIARAIDAGATLATHLGNGIATPLPRHPNPIWSLAADDRVSASLIADGHHLDRATLRVLIRAKGPSRAILVSDASPLAGLPAGRYGEWEVERSGRIVLAGTPYLAGAWRGLDFAVDEIRRAEPSLSLRDALDLASTRPARLLGLPEATVGSGSCDHLMVVRDRPDGLERVGAIAGGRWIGASDASRRAL